MKQFKKQLIRIIAKQVSELNGEVNTEDLNMTIAKTIVNEKFKNSTFMDNVQILKGEKDNGIVYKNKVWVYRDGIDKSWVFEGFNTIAEAINKAVKLVNSVILLNGEELLFDMFDDNTAYYIEHNTGKVKVVDIHG